MQQHVRNIILGQLWTQVASVHHEYGRLTLATAGLLFYFTLRIIDAVLFAFAFKILLTKLFASSLLCCSIFTLVLIFIVPICFYALCNIVRHVVK